jgi:hypothetical protein
VEPLSRELHVLMVVTELHAFGIPTFNLPFGVVVVVFLLFFVKRSEISVSQSRRSCENGGVGIFKRALLSLYSQMLQ